MKNLTFDKHYCLFWLCVLFFSTHSATAQVVEVENIKYDFYGFRWTGLTGYSFDDGTITSAISQHVYSAIKPNEGQQSDLERVFLPHYLGKKVQDQTPVKRYSLLNFVVRDSQVVTLHTFLMDSSHRMHRYWTTAVKGKNEDFIKLGEQMHDSVKLFLQNPEFNPPQTIQDEWKQTFKTCILPLENQFLGNLIPKNWEENAHTGKYNAENCMLAIGKYLQYNDAKFFDDFVSDKRTEKARKKFSKKYPRIWMMANSLKTFHSIKTFFRDASKNPRKRMESIAKAEKIKPLFYAYAVDSLPGVPISASRKQEYNLWMKYQPQYNLDSLAIMLQRAAQLIFTCQKMIEIADSSERNKAWNQAISQYMDVLRNEDVTNILTGFGTSEANCGDLKGIAKSRVGFLRDTLKKIYLDTLHSADMAFRNATTLKDSLKAIEMYHYANMLNGGLSALGTVKMQQALMELGDNLKACTEVAQAETHYKRALVIAKTDLTDLLRQRLLTLEQRKWQCEQAELVNPSYNPTPYPTHLPDTVFIQLDENSNPEEKVFLSDKIGNIFYKNLTGNTNDISMVGKTFDFQFLNGKVKFSLTVDADKVKGSLSEMNFPLGQYVGDPYVEQEIVDKFVHSIQQSYEAIGVGMDTVFIEHTGSADRTPFGTDCVPERQDFKSANKLKVMNCETGELAVFKNLVCGSQQEKNLALAFLRAYRRKKLMDEKLGMGLPIRYALCGQVSPQAGPQYRYVNTEIVFQFKKKFNYMYKID